MACTTVESNFNELIPATGITEVTAQIDSGDLSYRGAPRDTFAVDGRSWGMSTQVENAERNYSSNHWNVDSTPTSLLIQSQSDYNWAGVDFDIDGPEQMNTFIETGDGLVKLQDMVGYHTVTASKITTDNLHGSVNFLATNGSSDIEIYPTAFDTIRIEALDGDVTLRLPWGQPYDLQVWGDPEYGMSIENLGFYHEVTGPAYFAATSGPATLRVDVYVTGGSFTLLEAW